MSCYNWSETTTFNTFADRIKKKSNNKVEFIIKNDGFGEWECIQHSNKKKSMRQIIEDYWVDADEYDSFNQVQDIVIDTKTETVAIIYYGYTELNNMPQYLTMPYCYIVEKENGENNYNWVNTIEELFKSVDVAKEKKEKVIGMFYVSSSNDLYQQYNYINQLINNNDNYDEAKTKLYKNKTINYDDCLYYIKEKYKTKTRNKREHKSFEERHTKEEIDLYKTIFGSIDVKKEAKNVR